MTLNNKTDSPPFLILRLLFLRFVLRARVGFEKDGVAQRNERVSRKYGQQPLLRIHK